MYKMSTFNTLCRIQGMQNAGIGFFFLQNYWYFPCILFIPYSLNHTTCRLNQLSENVTHVVMGDRIEKDIKTLKAATYR